MSTLSSDRVRAALDALYADEEVKDEPVVAAVMAKNRPLGSFSHQEQTEMLAEAYISIPREVGDLVYLMARSRGAKRIVEFGTSFGISTLFLAAAARDNGGEVITTEWHAGKAEIASKNIADAGFDDIVDVRVGDALETLKDLPGPIDMVFLDGWKDIYLPVLKLIESSLAPNAVVIADDMGTLPEQPYFDHVRTGGGYHSVHVPIGDGLEVSLRVAE
ncbi:O-methyltransferase [Embleya scabrispora]|jgi:predicted O-methyltransferase YrrM|uniref:Putative O-methyltransferase n=1 Tax=Embleya scabrispora TaxID=159449 RepID=A0A0F7R6I4_9ACTN|nr:class I SAM-dependent methyltransferase [Embleya scabrispora]MYS86800.1 methyltransferase [Streptomyces sp. SID5474]BAR73023.1 putative O-methyltransferase [Embleya scabrispora]